MMPPYSMFAAHYQPDRSHQYTKGRTWQTYWQSIKSNWNQGFLDNHDLMYRLSTSNFKKLLIVPGLLSNFHRSDLTLQKLIFERLDNGECIWATALHLKLLHETRLHHNDVLQWIAVRPKPNDPTNQAAQFKRPSVEFEARIRDLLNYIAIRGEETGYNRSSRNDYLNGMLLGVKHGEEKVTKILDLWMEQEIKTHFYNFTQVVEDWKKIKEYPLDWGITLINSHECVDYNAYTETI